MCAREREEECARERGQLTSDGVVVVVVVVVEKYGRGHFFRRQRLFALSLVLFSDFDLFLTLALFLLPLDRLSSTSRETQTSRGTFRNKKNPHRQDTGSAGRRRK